MSWFKRKPQREKSIRKGKFGNLFGNKRKQILKCIAENEPDFEYCGVCDLGSQCERIQKQIQTGVKD